jgi:hypothetical protein
MKQLALVSRSFLERVNMFSFQVVPRSSPCSFSRVRKICGESSQRNAIMRRDVKIDSEHKAEQGLNSWAPWGSVISVHFCISDFKCGKNPIYGKHLRYLIFAFISILLNFYLIMSFFGANRALRLSGDSYYVDLFLFIFVL